MRARASGDMVRLPDSRPGFGTFSSSEPNKPLSFVWRAAICFRIERASSSLLIGCSQNERDFGIVYRGVWNRNRSRHQCDAIIDLGSEISIYCILQLTT